MMLHSGSSVLGSYRTGRSRASKLLEGNGEKEWRNLSFENGSRYINGRLMLPHPGCSRRLLLRAPALDRQVARWPGSVR
jgi:hypothetical protein